jgi:hypothetical protein
MNSVEQLVHEARTTSFMDIYQPLLCSVERITDPLDKYNSANELFDNLKNGNHFIFQELNDRTNDLLSVILHKLSY